MTLRTSLVWADTPFGRHVRGNRAAAFECSYGILASSNSSEVFPMARSRKSSYGRRPIVSVALASACACAAVALFPSEAWAGPGRFDLGFDGEAPVLLAP